MLLGWLSLTKSLSTKVKLSYITKLPMYRVGSLINSSHRLVSAQYFCETDSCMDHKPLWGSSTTLHKHTIERSILILGRIPREPQANLGQHIPPQPSSYKKCMYIIYNHRRFCHYIQWSFTASMLYDVVWCCMMLYDVVWCCRMLHVVRCCMMLYDIVWCCTMLYD